MFWHAHASDHAKLLMLPANGCKQGRDGGVEVGQWGHVQLASSVLQIQGSVNFM